MLIQTKLLLCAFLLLLGVGIGYSFERSRFDTFKGEIKGEGAAQVTKVKAADQQNKGDANVSVQKYQADIQSVHDYYKLHPVIRFVRVYDNSPCTVPRPPADTESPDAAPAASYASPYSPEDSETVAVRLYDLQTRLLAGEQAGTVKVGD